MIIQVSTCGCWIALYRCFFDVSSVMWSSLTVECAAYRGDDAQESIDNAIDGLMGDLSSVATRWMQIGVFLGVEFSFLEERVHSKDLQQNLSDTLTNWLESSSSPSGNVTLQRLVEAIEHTGGGNKPRLAATIKAKLTS